MLEDRVILKEDRAFVVSDLLGDIGRDENLGFGLYHMDTRFLSGFELTLNGRRPILLNHGIGRGYVATFQLINPRLELPSGDEIPMQTLSVRRTRFLRRGMRERIGIQNCGQEHVSVKLELSFRADFLDIFEVRGFQAADLPAERAVRVERSERGIEFAYDGADGIARRTQVVCDPMPKFDGDVATLDLSLRPQETFVVLVTVIPHTSDAPVPTSAEFETALASVERAHADWRHACTELQSDNERLDHGLLTRSADDLRLLCDVVPSGLFPTAGVPWYAVPFGRDAIITAVQALILNPELARGTLTFLAQHQGRGFDEYREEQPGKILHEFRFGELANLGQVPHTPYYGSCDSTPLFLVLLVEYLEWTGDVDLAAELMPNVLAALEWMERYGDLDGDQFIEYTHGPDGVRNESWKDSSDSLTEADGSTPPPPIAPVEVQGYAYRAQSGVARIFRRLGRTDEAAGLEARARSLRARFNEVFWMPEDRFYAQALSGTKEPVRAISSNVGHDLWSGVVDAGRAPEVVARLMAPEMYTGWGIRTLSSGAVSYNPMSYHNGSVWPHDNSLIAAGLRRYGFHDQAERIARAILEAGMTFGDSRLPELFCGFSRDRRFNSGPVEYLVSCSPQAWAAGATFLFLQTLAGVTVDSLDRVITIDPVPTSLYRRLRVEGLRAAGGELDFTIERDVSGLRVRVDRTPPGVEVRLPA